MRRVVCLLLLLITPLFGDAPPKKESPEKIAFREARAKTDPGVRLEALRQFLKQYPKSQYAGSAKWTIVTVLVKNFPDRAEDIQQAIKVDLKDTKGENRMYEYSEIADLLADADILLPQARDFAQKGVKMLPKESKYGSQMRKEMAKAKMPTPSEQEVHKEYLHEHSHFIAILGRVEVKFGNVTEGQQLLKTALEENPDNSTAGAELGMLALKAGKNDEALTLLTHARLAGSLDKTQQKSLEDLYAKAHGGSMEGFDDYLNASYSKLFPLPYAVKKYDGATSDRTVLAELFTGSGCPPCAGADLAFDGMIDRYSRKQVAVLEYDEHIPKPDPLTNPDSVARFEFYSGGGTPTLVIDGATKVGGGGRDDAKSLFGDLDARVLKAAKAPAEAQIQVTAIRDGGSITVHASANNIKGDWKNPKLRIALVEDDITYSGENGIRFHRFVVRSLASKDGFPVKGEGVDYTFDTGKICEGLKTYLDGYEKSNDRYGPITFIQKKDTIDLTRLSVIVFVQDSDTKHVLQAAVTDVRSAR